MRVMMTVIRFPPLLQAGIGGMALDYGIRGNLGATYDCGCDTTLGLYWQTKKHFQFDNAISIGGGAFQDINLASSSSISRVDSKAALFRAITTKSLL